MAKRKVGKPTIRTEEVVRKLEQAAEIDCNISEMCFHADISRETYYQWIKKDKKFADRIERIRKKPFVNAKLTLQKAIAKGDADMALKFLERRSKEEYSPRQEVSASVNTKDEKQAAELAKARALLAAIPPDQLARLLKYTEK